MSCAKNLQKKKKKKKRKKEGGGGRGEEKQTKAIINKRQGETNCLYWCCVK